MVPVTPPDDAMRMVDVVQVEARAGESDSAEHSEEQPDGQGHDLGGTPRATFDLRDSELGRFGIAVSVDDSTYRHGNLLVACVGVLPIRRASNTPRRFP